MAHEETIEAIKSDIDKSELEQLPTANAIETSSDNNLEFVFTEIGDFSVYQAWKYIWLSIPIALSAAYAISFVVTATDLDYRCRIPECDVDSASYTTDWFKSAIPVKNGRLQKCRKFDINATALNEWKTFQRNTDNSSACPQNIFNKNQIIQCNDFVQRTKEYRLIQEFNLFCEENEYKLVLVGTISNLGGSIFKPFIGVLSDKFGRLNILIAGVIGNSLLGISKAFAWNYYAFVTFEFFESAVGTCIFTAAFVLCVEWVSTKNRVLSCTICLLCYPVGEILTGLLAMYVPNLRSFLLIMYTPGLLVIFYYWLIPESVRWLLVTGHRKRALDILRRMAKGNGKELSQKSEYIVYEKAKESATNNKRVENEVETIPIQAIFKSSTLRWRLFECSITWIVCTNVFFSLTYSSAKIDGDENKYLSFILVVSAKIPAAICTQNLLDRLGRRTTLCSGLIIAGLATIATVLNPVDQTILTRIFFFTAMLSISISLSTLFIYTAELWPTSLRNTLLNFCATTGRIGAVAAPLTPLLAHILPSLPYLTIGTIAILTGLLVFRLPETLKKKLPDTIQEAILL